MTDEEIEEAYYVEMIAPLVSIVVRWVPLEERLRWRRDIRERLAALAAEYNRRAGR